MSSVARPYSIYYIELGHEDILIWIPNAILVQSILLYLDTPNAADMQTSKLLLLPILFGATVTFAQSKQTRLSEEKAGEFYAIHKARPFYGELVQFMSSGPIIAAILEKENAVAAFRTLIGATDPAKADANTIRKLYAQSVGENAVHGSDSDDNAKIEGDFFFSGLERF